MLRPHDPVLVDGRHRGHVMASGTIGVTVRFGRKTIELAKGDRAEQLRRDGGCLFIPAGEVESRVQLIEAEQPAA